MTTEIASRNPGPAAVLGGLPHVAQPRQVAAVRCAVGQDHRHRGGVLAGVDPVDVRRDVAACRGRRGDVVGHPAGGLDRSLLDVLGGRALLEQQQGNGEEQQDGQGRPDRE